MNTLLMLFLLQPQEPAPATQKAVAIKPTELRQLIEQVAASGRVLSLARSFDEKIRISPGAPPLLTFRYLDGRQRGRFGGLDLVLDDASH